MPYYLPENEEALRRICYDKYISIEDGLTVFQIVRKVILRLIPFEMWAAAEEQFYNRLGIDPSDEETGKAEMEKDPDGWEEVLK